MPSIAMTAAWIVHMALVAMASYWCAKKIGVPLRDRPFVVFLLAWANLVLASQGASLFLMLNSLPVYIVSALVSMGLLWGFLKFSNRQAPALVSLTPLPFVELSSEKLKRNLGRFVVISLGIAAFCHLFVTFLSNPDNADSIIYRLPRAFWYVSNGSFLHPFEGIDKRLIFYPLDGVSFYVPMVLYATPAVFFNTPSPFMWVAIGYATYRFARDLGADRLLSLCSAWLIVMTPNILAQAVSTNDEIMAAAALLVGLYMGFRWLTTGKGVYFFLWALGVGLSIGTKLHIVFLSPIIFAAFAVLIWKAIKNPALLKTWGNAIGWKPFSAALTIGLMMTVTFLIYNYLSIGRLYFLNDFSHDVFNLKASLHGMLQNILIYGAQMMVAPISDLNMWPYSEDRQVFGAALNAITDPFIRPFINPDPSFYHAQYRFVGVIIPTSVRFVEFSLWAGFVWLLWPVQIGRALKLQQKDFPLKILFVLFAVTPLAWLLLWSASTLYMEGTATYFSFYLIMAAPATSFVFLTMRRVRLSEIRWVLLIIVAITNTIIAINIFCYNGFRAIPDIVRASKRPYDWLLFDETVVKEVQNADRIQILFTHEKMPYFAYMHRHPRAIYLDPYMAELPKGDPALKIVPVSSFYAFGFMPIKVPGKLTTGASFIGLIRGIGREAIFGLGNGIEKRYPQESDYILKKIEITRSAKGGFDIGYAAGFPIGYSPDDHLEFRYEIKGGTQTVFLRDWDKEILYNGHIDINPLEYQLFMTISVRSEWSHKIMASQTYQLLGPGAWLPDGPEY